MGSWMGIQGHWENDRRDDVSIVPYIHAPVGAGVPTGPKACTDKNARRPPARACHKAKLKSRSLRDAIKEIERHRGDEA